MSFRSYISYKSEDGQVNLQDDEADHPCSTLKAPLLPGEVIIACAENVLKFDAFSDQKRGVSGSLFCTNFKLSFVTADPFYQSNDWKIKNLLIDENDICLSNIDCVFQGSGIKKKKFSPGTSISSKIKILEVLCKNFRVHTYSFKFSPVGHAKAIVNSVLHHAFPPKIKLMFAFEYKTPLMKRRENILRYNSPADWRDELEKCKCQAGWRVSQVNETFKICDSLPESFVVPNIPVDANLIRGAPHFTGHRLLKWCWGNRHGNCIVRMATLDPVIIESHQLQIMMDYVQGCHPCQKQPRSFTMDELLPTYKDIQTSFLKLKGFCIAESATDFWEQDALFKSAMESSKWFHNVSSCLNVAKDVASTILFEKTSVILHESDDRDLNCVISSLVQLILDPHYRTVQGFQSLIQKEWVAMGHRFSLRLNQVRGNEQEESPVFLLFLDCVWQLLKQFPTVFEFTEIYLTVLWDSTKVMIFETFLFNSPKQRFDALYYATDQENLRLQSVWDWNLQFTSDDTELFINPLYVVSYEVHNYMRSIIHQEKRHSKQEKHIKSQNERQILCRMLAWSEDNLLDLKKELIDLSIWEICYFRWLPFSQVQRGGSPSMLFEQQKITSEILNLMKNVHELQNKLADGTTEKNYHDPSFQFKKSLTRYEKMKNTVSSSFPFSSNVATDHRSGYSIPILLQKNLSDSNQDLSNIE